MARLHQHDQHFLRSPRIVAELIGHSNIRKNDTVCDLGAGSGIISSVLSGRVKQVYAVEHEPKALALLKKNLAHVENVSIIDIDILSFTPPSSPYKIFANIPFSLSSDIVRHYLFHKNPPKACFLIVQRQFARKLVPGDDHFTSQLSAELSPLYTMRIRKPLRKTDFTPPPAVDTVLLEFKRREQPLITNKAESAAYRTFAQQCFSDQRFYQSVVSRTQTVSPELRPSQLTPEQSIALFRSYHHQ